MRERGCILSFVPSNDTIVYLNKPSIIRNGGELSDLEYLLAKTENVRYLQNAGTRTSRLFWPFIQHYSRFKQAQDHKNRWRIDWPRLPALQTEDAEYLKNTDTRASRLLEPFKPH